MAKSNPVIRQYGFWKCGHCGAENSGKYKLCLQCGGPIPQLLPNQISVFYLKPGAMLVEKASEDALKLAGPDWICSSCSANNSGMLRFCKSCSHPREESDTTRKKVFYKRGARVPQTWEETFLTANEMKAQSGLGKFFTQWNLTKILLMFAPLLMIFALLSWCNRDRPLELELESKSWKRTIVIEKWKTVREGDWAIPKGGREVSRSQKVHHYNKVFDHYQTKQVAHTRSVPDGTESYTTTSDNGDGTFSTETHTSTKYRTETYYETVTEAVYRDEPVYQTWYDYDIEKWAYERQADTLGVAEVNGWPAFKLKELEREGVRYITYSYSFKASDPELKFTPMYQDNSDSLYMALEKGKRVMAILNEDSTIQKLEPVK